MAGHLGSGPLGGPGTDGPAVVRRPPLASMLALGWTLDGGAAFFPGRGQRVGKVNQAQREPPEAPRRPALAGESKKGGAEGEASPRRCPSVLWTSLPALPQCSLPVEKLASGLAQGRPSSVLSSGTPPARSAGPGLKTRVLLEGGFLPPLPAVAWMVSLYHIPG